VFNGAQVFNSDLSKWNVTKVTNMVYSTFQFPLFSSPHPAFFFFLSFARILYLFVRSYFYKELILTHRFSLLFSFFLFGTSAVFQNAKVFNSDLSEWNVTKVTAMDGSTFQFPLFNSFPTTCFLFLCLSPFVLEFFINFALSIFTKELILTHRFSLLFSFFLFGTSAVFDRAEVFTSDLLKWNVAKVTDMYQSTF